MHTAMIGCLGLALPSTLAGHARRYRLGVAGADRHRA
jgi:hypothetical protein